MVPHPFVYQLVLLALIWLFIIRGCFKGVDMLSSLSV
jgi:hypothetical protein